MLRLIGLLAMLSAAGERADDAGFLVVVHPSQPMASITRAELSAIYMKRTRSWGDGSEILPLDQTASSFVRERFSRAVHGKNVAYVTRYWQRLIFSGRGIPPRQLPGDAAVLELVKHHRGAIGYIAPGTPPGDGVKIIPVTP